MAASFEAHSDEGARAEKARVRGTEACPSVRGSNGRRRRRRVERAGSYREAADAGGAEMYFAQNRTRTLGASLRDVKEMATASLYMEKQVGGRLEREGLDCEGH